MLQAHVGLEAFLTMTDRLTQAHAGLEAFLTSTDTLPQAHAGLEAFLTMTEMFVPGSLPTGGLSHHIGHVCPRLTPD